LERIVTNNGKISPTPIAGSFKSEIRKRQKSHACVPLKPVCRLKVDAEHLKVEEDKLKIIWHAAGIEKWLLGMYVL
jgi:hypothetical protein